MSPHTADGQDGPDGPVASKTSADTQLLDDFLQANPAVKYVRFQWLDLSGILRGRIFPAPRAVDAAHGRRKLGIAPAAFHIALGNKLLPDLDARGLHELVPDWRSLATRPTLDPKYAVVMCAVTEQTPGCGAPNWGLCPRTALGRAVRRVSEKLDVNVLIGFEIEFEVFKDAGGGRFELYSNAPGYFAVSGYRDPLFGYVEEAVEVLEAAGVLIDTVQTEGSRGQYEVTLPPLPPVAAVDQVLFAQDAIKAVFARHGLMATMAPRPMGGGEESNGQHAHVSLNPPSHEASFLAGIMGRLSDMAALCLPYGVSYERIAKFCAGSAVAWGTENRAVPVRKIKAGHWEMRFLDASANMYLALAAILGAGLAGCERGEELTWGDTAFDEEQAPRDGEMLPGSLGEALDRLERAEGRDEWVEGEIARHYVKVKRFEEGFCREDVEGTRNLMIETF